MLDKCDVFRSVLPSLLFAWQSLGVYGLCAMAMLYDQAPRLACGDNVSDMLLTLKNIDGLQANNMVAYIQERELALAGVNVAQALRQALFAVVWRDLMTFIQ